MNDKEIKQAVRRDMARVVWLMLVSVFLLTGLASILLGGAFPKFRDDIPAAYLGGFILGAVGFILLVILGVRKAEKEEAKKLPQPFYYFDVMCMCGRLSVLTDIRAAMCGCGAVLSVDVQGDGFIPQAKITRDTQVWQHPAGSKPELVWWHEA